MSHATHQTYDKLGVISAQVPTLLPTTMIPVQLRNPADIELAREAIAHGRMIALSPPGARLASLDVTTDGETVSEEIGTLAQIADFTELQDGGLLLLLRGVERIRFLEDHAEEDDTAPGTSFRRVRAERLISDQRHDSRAAELRRAILGTLLALSSVGIHGADMLHDGAVGLQDPGAVADFVGARILLHPAERLGLFRDTDAVSRLEQVEDRLTHILIQHSLTTDDEVLN